MLTEASVSQCPKRRRLPFGHTTVYSVARHVAPSFSAS